MSTDYSMIMKKLEAIKHLSAKGGEYWAARELMEILAYAKWENFLAVIERAKTACISVSEEISDHFLDIRKVIEAGKGAKHERTDYYLDRYACYLIAQNGDPSKPEIAAAQTYFAVQTRLQEKTQANERLLLEQRIHLRKRVTQAVKELNKTAKQVGVKNYAAFQNAGYMGLYEMGLADIKKRKKLSPKEDLFDRAGRAELAANEFRLTQAEEKIKRDSSVNEKQAITIHKEVGKEVRMAICKIGGVMPRRSTHRTFIKTAH